MPASASTLASLSLLVPSSVLPGENEELPARSWESPAESMSDIIRAFQDLAAPRAARFLISGRDIALQGSIEQDSTLLHVKLSADEKNGHPSLQVSPAMTHIDWSEVLRETGKIIRGKHFLGQPEEAARIFVKALRSVIADAASGFAGEPLPLLRVEKAEEGMIVSLLGVWLSDSSRIEEMCRHLPAHPWQDAITGNNGSLILDVVEVEGRGLKEAIISATMLGAILASSAYAGDVKPASASVSKFASFFSGTTKRGEKLQIKSQKLVQDAPRIYRDVLEAPHTDLRVIVNIGSQRAYIVKDGVIAFDTPISSAAAGHRTPRGSFTITEKVRTGKMSTIYKCPLPGWMRLGDTAVGMHQGDLPGYPASHGCIRMPLESALFIFDHVKVGTPVEVVDTWSPQAAAPRAELIAQAN